MNNFNDLENNFSNAKILLIGDIMLDSFVYGGVSRISPEGPIPILSVSREDTMLGGAGNVFANLRSLECETHIISVIGHDGAGSEIVDRVSAAGVAVEGLIIDENRPTILKTRYLSQNQQLLRVDRENSTPINQRTQDRVFEHAAKVMGSINALILSDYGKGVLTPDLVKRLIKVAKKNKVPVIVDPKGKDFSVYKGATIVTPNKKELSEAVNGLPVSNDAEVEHAAQILIKKCGIENIIATRSEDGISVIPKKGEPIHLPTQALEIYDVSGAGDTVVAVISAVMAAGGSLEDAAQLSNIAGGLVVAKVGTATIQRSELFAAALEGNLSSRSNNRIAVIADRDAAQEQIHKWQAQGLSVGFTNGCFDILHYGHVNYLNQARDKCDRLVVGLNHDASVRILKGETRPINDEMARATVLGALGSVDLVVFFGAENPDGDNTPCDLVKMLRPDILMKGGDYTVDQLPEGQVVLSYGGKVEIMPLYEGYSTTNIIKKGAESTA